MPSPRKGLPVTGTVALGTFFAVGLTGVSTAKSGSVSKLTVAVPVVSVDAGSTTKDDPFHTVTALDAVTAASANVADTGLRNVPG